MKSPSMRREWIEIPVGVTVFEILKRLPPCGGSGLKCRPELLKLEFDTSPSMRREWIEISRKR